MTFGPAETVKFLMDEFSDATSRIVEHPQIAATEIPKVSKLIGHIERAAKELPVEEQEKILAVAARNSNVITQAINVEASSLIRQTGEIAEAIIGDTSEEEVAALLKTFRAPGPKF